MTVAETILDQLGGNKFITMTGSKNFIAEDYALSMKLAKNKSAANHLRIYLNGLDLYEMEFSKVTFPKFNLKTGKMRNGENKEIVKYNGVMFDQLQSLFTSVTGLDTHL